MASSPNGEGGRPGPARRLLDPLDRFTGALSGALAWIGALVLLVVMGVVGYSVLMRYVFNDPQTWADELVGYLTVLIVMLGAAEALRRRDHVSVDLLTGRLQGRKQLVAEVLAVISVLVVALVLVYGGWGMIAFARMVGLVSEGYLEMPMWIPQSAIVLGMGMLALAALVRLVRLLTGVEKPPEEGPTAPGHAHNLGEGIE